LSLLFDVAVWQHLMGHCDTNRIGAIGVVGATFLRFCLAIKTRMGSKKQAHAARLHSQCGCGSSWARLCYNFHFMGVSKHGGQLYASI